MMFTAAAFMIAFSTIVCFASAAEQIPLCAHALTEPERLMCELVYDIDQKSRAAAQAPTKQNSAYNCKDLNCLCPYYNGSVIAQDGSCILENGKKLQRVTRKEYRRMSDEERSRFHAAMNQLKQSGEFDVIAAWHLNLPHGAHGGPAFALWHREYSKRFEIALRLLDPEVSLPYWDPVLDQNLPDSRDSILWSPLFFGETDSSNFVVTGPFANWTTSDGYPAVRRELGRIKQSTLFTEEQVESVYKQTSLERGVFAYVAPHKGCIVEQPDISTLEYLHGNPHIWVGGHMGNPFTSANDPLFFVYHGFTDLLWENWRQMHQTREQRENDFVADIIECSPPQHFRLADMKPFDGMRNIDGLSNAYTDNLYQYEQRPTCSRTQPDCGSIYLFCDTAHGAPRCLSKMREGGKCDGLGRPDVCFDGVCQNGRCMTKNANTGKQ
uniref:Tyrosinase copper-binding domain-containing protein n=1 Tax=Plectus sambesii TaxID=2011161 RepID=A0A914X740_9BILA